MAAVAAATPFIAPFTTTTTLASTAPANGDQNPGAGDLFGLAVRPDASGVLFVDDFDTTLRLFH